MTNTMKTVSLVQAHDRSLLKTKGNWKRAMRLSNAISRRYRCELAAMVNA